MTIDDNRGDPGGAFEDVAALRLNRSAIPGSKWDRVRRRPATGSGNASWRDRTAFEESFRVLRSSLEVVLNEIEHPIVMLTSSKANEGKTVVCAKLALSFVQAGRRVVAVDLDLRNPSAHRMLQTHNEYGMSDVLLGNRSLQDSLQHLQVRDGSDNIRSLYFIGTGPAVQNPAELLGSGRTARTLDGLAKEADIVLIDTPPVLPVADSLVIGRYASGAILVVESRETAFQLVQQSKDLLIRNQTRLLGVIMNKFEASGADRPYSYYSYGYGEGAEPVGPDAGFARTPGFKNGSAANGSA